MTAYKFTRAGGQPTHGTGVWTPGKWRTVSPPIQACRRGLHYCERPHLIHWLGPVIWRFEDGDPETRIVQPDKCITTKGRITERVETWNERTARLFAADCAEAVLPLFEKVRPEDDRPRKSIQAARAYARGESTAAAGAARTARLFDYIEGRAA